MCSKEEDIDKNFLDGLEKDKVIKMRKEYTNTTNIKFATKTC